MSFIQEDQQRIFRRSFKVISALLVGSLFFPVIVKNDSFNTISGEENFSMFNLFTSGILITRIEGSTEFQKNYVAPAVMISVVVALSLSVACVYFYTGSSNSKERIEILSLLMLLSGIIAGSSYNILRGLSRELNTTAISINDGYELGFGAHMIIASAVLSIGIGIYGMKISRFDPQN